MGDLTENFSAREFACKCPKDCTAKDGSKMDVDLVRDLQIVREVRGETIAIVSGLRCPEWNRHEGGKEDSAHLTGNGADIACNNSNDRFELIGALRAIFNRMGLAKTFIHVDNLPVSKKAQEVTWVY